MASSLLLLLQFDHRPSLLCNLSDKWKLYCCLWVAESKMKSNEKALPERFVLLSSFYALISFYHLDLKTLHHYYEVKHKGLDLNGANHALSVSLFSLFHQKWNPFDFFSSFHVMVYRSASGENVPLSLLYLVNIPFSALTPTPQLYVCVITCLVCTHSVRCTMCTS